METSSPYRRRPAGEGRAQAGTAPRAVSLALYVEFDRSFTGGPRAVCNLVAMLDRGRFEPTVITNRESGLTDELRRIGVEPVVLPQPARIGADDGRTLAAGAAGQLRAAADVLAYNARVLRVLRAAKAECVWVRGVKGVLLTGLAAKALRIPVLWDIGMEQPSRGAVRRLHELAFSLSERVVVEGRSVPASVFDAKQLGRHRRKLRVIPPGLPKERVLALRQRSTPRRPADGRFVIVSVGSINPRKNQLMLVQAFGALAERYPHARLDLVGPITDDGYGRELERFIGRHALSERVALLGWRDDVAELLMQADLFALASRVEGVPYGVMEAMHAGVPVVATAAGGIPDVIEDGLTGYVVAVDDVAALTARLDACLADPAALIEIASAAERFVAVEYSVERWAERHQAELGELLEGRGRGRR